MSEVACERLLNTESRPPRLSTSDPHLFAARFVEYAADAAGELDTAKLAALATQTVVAGLVSNYDLPNGLRDEVAEMAYLSIHEVLLCLQEQTVSNVRRRMRRATVRYLIPRIGERSAR